LVQGELIYVTDYESAGVSPLWVGDGSTPGGQEIATGSGSPAVLTQNLNLNNNNIFGSGNITATAFVGDGSGLTNLPTITSADLEELNNVVITSPVNGQALVYSSGNWINSAVAGGVGDGVVEGSNYRINIIADDSSLLVDSDNGEIAASALLGFVPDLSISQSSVTQHESALSITQSQISDLQDFVLATELGNFTFVGRIIDTSDSSSIIITPAVAIQSDLTVENNLTVSNKLVVNGIETQNLSTGYISTPEIISNAAISLDAQTNINTTATTGNISLTASSGDINANADTYNVTAGSGITNTATTGNISLTASSGDIQVSGTNITATGIVGVTGDVTITGLATVNGNVQVDSVILSNQTTGSISVPTDGELIFDADGTQLYIYSQSAANWLNVLSVDLAGGILNTNAVLIPSNTDTISRDSIGQDSTTYDGAILYNTDVDRLQVFQAGSWVSMPNNGSAIGEVLRWNGTEWAASVDPASGTTTNSDNLGGFGPSFYLDYNNFTNTPTIPADVGDLTDTGNLLFDGVYSSLTGKPTIPTALSDLTNDVGYITTEFSFAVGADDSSMRNISRGESFKIIGGTAITTASDTEGNITITGIAQDFAFSSLTSTPTTLSGYGITDAVLATDLGNFTFTNSVLDTDDSSGITVTPPTVFSSDVTVQNNLTVTNKIVANTIEVENIITTPTAGTPELSSDGAILLTAGTRVEITQSPLKMASFTSAERDLLAAQNGDMIYNTTTNKFQGYANSTWVDLH
jgi:hypothetical protein